MKSESINTLSDTELFLLKINACYEPELSVKGTQKAIEIIQNQMKQITQLTNNWNELEEWLKEQQEFLKGTPTFLGEIYFEHKTMNNTYQNVLDKMKEIKENNK